MSAGDRFREIFGGLSSLADPIPWTENIANIYEHIAWYTADVLGISKTRYWKQMVAWADEPEMRALPLDARLAALDDQLQMAIRSGTGLTRYAPREDTVASPYEALRRSRYFRESYLNHEFDMLMSLASDKYITSLYADVFAQHWPGEWSTHGNGGRFQNATFADMQIDNICYNRDSRLIVANELKLGGRKNSDQILKYAHLFLRLKELALVPPDTRFNLLFISDHDYNFNWEREIEMEVAMARRSRKASARQLILDEVVGLAYASDKALLTWGRLMQFNREWLATLPMDRQVENKLVSGFNATLGEKFFIQLQGT